MHVVGRILENELRRLTDCARYFPRDFDLKLLTERQDRRMVFLSSAVFGDCGLAGALKVVATMMASAHYIGAKSDYCDLELWKPLESLVTEAENIVHAFQRYKDQFPWGASFAHPVMDGLRATIAQARRLEKFPVCIPNVLVSNTANDYASDQRGRRCRCPGPGDVGFRPTRRHPR